MRNLFTKVNDFYFWLRHETRFGRFCGRLEYRYFYKIRCYFNPRHKKLRNVIPKTWRDSVELIRELNFTVLTEFFEDEIGGEEKCLELAKLNEDANKKEGFVNGWPTFYRELAHYYSYITKIRPLLLEDLNGAYPEIPEKYKKDIIGWLNEPHSYEERYGEVDRIQKLLEEKDHKTLIWIINNRGHFWT